MKPNEFVTSDLHLGHSAIIEYEERPFASVEEMDEQIVQAWNAKIPEGSVVYLLGDV